MFQQFQQKIVAVPLNRGPIWIPQEELGNWSRCDEPEMIRLTNIEGFSVLSGKDSAGADWKQFSVDYLAEQLPGECAICGAILESGWLCLDDGEEVCDEHVLIAD